MTSAMLSEKTARLCRLVSFYTYNELLRAHGIGYLALVLFMNDEECVLGIL